MITKSSTMASTIFVLRPRFTTLAVLVLFPLLAVCIYLYRRAYRRRPYPGIPYNSPATRNLWGDIPELIAEAQKRRDPSQVTFPHFQRHQSPIIQLFLAPFWKPMIYINDTREVDDALTNRTRIFDKSWTTAAPFRPVVPGASICKVKGPEWKAQVRLWTDVISVGYLRDITAPIMHTAALELVALFRAKAEVGGGRPFWANEDYKIATFDVIWKSMLGADLQGIRYERDAVLASGEERIEQPESLDEPACFGSASKSDEWEAAAYFTSVIPKFVMFPVPSVAAFFWSLTPTWRKHWVTKKRFMGELLASSRSRFANLDESMDESVAEKRDICALDRALRKFAKVAPDDVYRPSMDDMYDELLLMLVSVRCLVPDSYRFIGLRM